MKKYYCIKERHNPETNKPCYIKKGLLTKKESILIVEHCAYGKNIVHEYATEVEYNNALEKLRSDGCYIRGEK